MEHMKRALLAAEKMLDVAWVALGDFEPDIQRIAQGGFDVTSRSDMMLVKALANLANAYLSLEKISSDSSDPEESVEGG